MASLDILLRILDLEQVDGNRFRGISPQTGRTRVFGGQVLAQALAAAERTVTGRPAHSLHAYFVLPGDPSIPIDYAVENIRDGGSFSVRRVTAIQADAAIFTLSASFQRVEDGYEHQVRMPDVPAPEDLPDRTAMLETWLAQAPEPVQEYWRQDGPIELRLVEPRLYAGRGTPEEPVRHVWLRAVGRLPDDGMIHRCALAYASDMTLLDCTLSAHRQTVLHPSIQGASLDHAIWFHRPIRADDWMLYVEESPSASGARGFATGRLFARDGRLLASVAQEGLIRRRGESGASAAVA